MRGACCKIAVSAWTQEAFSRNFPLARAPPATFGDAVGTPIELAAARARALSSRRCRDVLYYRAHGRVHCRLPPTLESGVLRAGLRAGLLRARHFAARACLRVLHLLGAGALLFAKTDWLASKVELHHNVTVSRIRAAVNLSSFATAREKRSLGGPTRPVLVVAMVRPGTSRRNPHPDHQGAGCSENEIG